MNRRFLTSAVAIHAGACLIAIVSVGAGAPIANGLMESSPEIVLPARPEIEVAAPATGHHPQAADLIQSVETDASELPSGGVELSSESLAFESTIEPEVISESSLLLSESGESAPGVEQPAVLRSAGR